MQPQTENIIAFVRSQLDSVRSQCALVEQGNLDAALELSAQLNRTLKGLPVSVDNIRGSDDSSALPILKEMVDEMIYLQQRAVESLQHSQNEVAGKLEDLNLGRQTLSRYRSGRREHRQIFDISG